MRVVVACDKFRGTLSARRATELVASTARSLHDVDAVEMPIADGGEGTIDVILARSSGRLVDVTVAGPVGEPVGAAFALLPDGTALVEMARASGVELLRGSRPAPLTASSIGTGELMRAACERSEAARVVVAVGGSASTDGGTGAARAFGWRFLDPAGGELEPGGGALPRLRHVEPPPCGPLTTPVLGAVDVAAPLVGDTGAARRYSPQKGATPAEVDVLERGLERLAAVLDRALGLDARAIPGAGAGGGMGAGLLAFFGGELRGGFDFVSEAVALGDAVARADVVVTGEGRLDQQSIQGKSTRGVARLAADRGVECCVIAGEISLRDDELRSLGFNRWVSLVDLVGRERAESEAEASIVAGAGALFSGTTAL